MRCRSCDHDNPEGSHFCLQCGGGLGVGCGACGNELPAGARFCNRCGAAVESGPEPPAPARRPGPPERSPLDYTPRHLAEKILSSKSALEGEHKRVTVLFADVKGSMDIQEGVDPELWHGIMDRFFQILADGVHRFEGTVNQYTGDGIMALFGAPITHEDHAQRACYAALHLTDALRDYARELRREHGLDFSTRMGLNSGEVVVGKIGDDLRMDYTAQGQSVGLAARMENLAEPGTVYLTGQTAELAGGYFELEDLGAFKVKGTADPVPVFQLRGMGPLRTRFDVSRARGLSRFVGRSADMQLLETALASAREGKGRAVGIVAPAGVGKSRLCFEFAERCRAQGLNVLEGHCVAHGKNVPLLPVLEIIRDYFAIGDGDDPRTAREKIAGRLLLIDESFREVLPLVFEFLGVPDPERPAPNLDAEARQRRILAVVRSLTERGNPEGFVILIEDLHWADPASEAFFAQWVDAISGGPGLLLLNFRPEYRADWMQKSWYQQLPLDPLGPEAIRELLSDVLGDDASVSGLAERIHERTRGNPYFTEEMVRALVDSGALEGSKGHYRLTRPVSSIEVPDSVHTVLGARIDRLGEREKKLLQTAAVIGREFSEPLLAAVAQLPAQGLADALSALQKGEFIHQQSLYPISEYAFAHPLTQEVALDSQLGEQRRRTHAAVARALQELEPERVDERAALLAHHYERAGEELEAARWHARAGQWVGMRDLGENLRHWQRARELLSALPDAQRGAEIDDLQLQACSQVMVASWRLGMAETAVDALWEEGSALAERTGNEMLLAVLRGAYSGRLASLGRLREALALAAESLRAVDDRPDVPALRAGPRVGSAYYRFALGDLEGSLAQLEEGIRLSNGDVEAGRDFFGFSYLIWFTGFRASLLAMCGRCGEGVEQMQHAFQLGRQSGLPENMGWLHGNLAALGVYTGETSFEALGDARASAVESVRIAEELGSAFSRVTAYGLRAFLHASLGEWKEAEAAASTSLEIARERRVGLENERDLLVSLSRAVLGLGDAARARALAEEAIALGEARGQRNQALAHVALVHALCAGEGRAARAAASRALDAADAAASGTGIRALVPRILEARAELAGVCGDAAAREHHLHEAHRVSVEIGATGHARRLAAELGMG